MTDAVDPATAPHEFELIDYRQLRNWAGFVRHAVVRRKLLAGITFVGVLTAVLLLLSVLPRTYHVEAQLLAQKNSLMSALGNPGRAIPADADAPTRGASEAVKRRDNLVSLMKQTDLMADWERTRPRVLRVRDQLSEMLLGARSDEERLNDMVGLLDQRLNVFVSEETVTIAIDWPQAEMAYRLVDAAQQNFLEQRHSTEVSTIVETISILEGHATSLRESIDAAMEDLRQAQGGGSNRARAPLSMLPRRDPAEEALKAEAADLKLRIEAKHRAISELEAFRNRRLAELQAELAQQRTVYADAHPVVVKLMESVAALQQNSPQLLALRNDERDLLAEQAKLPGSISPAPPGRTGSVDGRQRGGAGEDLTRDYARTRLRFAMEKYDTLMERLDSARIELDTARANFKYRYSVIRPPALPKRAVKPKVPVVVGMGVFAALGMAVLVATLADLRSGRVFEEWQVEKALGLRVLGEVPRA